MSELLQNLTKFEMIALLAAAVLLCAAVVLLLILIIFSIHPKLAPKSVQLKRYGNADRILKECHREMKTAVLLKQEKIVLTPHYLVDLEGGESIIPLESVLWVFEYQTMKHSCKAHRKIMHYYLQIVTITGDRFLLADKKKECIDKIIHELEERYPNFFYGYSKEHDEMVTYILEENRQELKALKKKEKKNKK